MRSSAASSHPCPGDPWDAPHLVAPHAVCSPRSHAEALASGKPFLNIPGQVASGPAVSSTPTSRSSLQAPPLSARGSSTSGLDGRTRPLLAPDSNPTPSPAHHISIALAPTALRRVRKRSPPPARQSTDTTSPQWPAPLPVPGDRGRPASTISLQPGPYPAPTFGSFGPWGWGKQATPQIPVGILYRDTTPPHPRGHRLGIT